SPPGVATTVAVGLVDGPELAEPGVPQAASSSGAMSANNTFLVIGVSLRVSRFLRIVPTAQGLRQTKRGRKGRGRCPFRGGLSHRFGTRMLIGILLASEIFQPQSPILDRVTSSGT